MIEILFLNFMTMKCSHKYNMLNYIVSCRNVSQLKAFWLLSDVKIILKYIVPMWTKVLNVKNSIFSMWTKLLNVKNSIFSSFFTYHSQKYFIKSLYGLLCSKYLIKAFYYLLLLVATYYWLIIPKSTL